MRNVLFLFVFINFIFSISAEDNSSSVLNTNNFMAFYINSSVSFTQSQFSNMSFGIESFFFHYDKNKPKILDFFHPYHYHNHLIGFDYKWNISNNDYSNILQLYYCFNLSAGYFDEFLYWATPIGLNIGYNFNTNDFVMGPKVGVYLNSLILFVSADYSYIIGINDIRKSYHQITLKLGIYIGKT